MVSRKGTNQAEAAIKCFKTVSRSNLPIWFQIFFFLSCQILCLEDSSVWKRKLQLHLWLTKDWHWRLLPKMQNKNKTKHPTSPYQWKTLCEAYPTTLSYKSLCVSCDYRHANIFKWGHSYKPVIFLVVLFFRPESYSAPPDQKESCINRCV